jgi:hypothetical protein
MVDDEEEQNVAHCWSVPRTPSPPSSPVHLPERPDSTWWDCLEPLEVRGPMESSGAHRGPWTFESKLVPASEEEHEALLVNSIGDDSEIVPETEVQDLVSTDSISKVDMKGKDVLGTSEDDGATKVVAQPAFVGVDPDAEADDQFIGTEGNKTSKTDKSMIEEQMVSYADLSFEDF